MEGDRVPVTLDAHDPIPAGVGSVYPCMADVRGVVRGWDSVTSVVRVDVVDPDGEVVAVATRTGYNGSGKRLVWTTHSSVPEWTADLRIAGERHRRTVAATDPVEAVRAAAAFAGVDVAAVKRLRRWPTCEYCDRVATRYVVETGEPLCDADSRDQYAQWREATGPLGVSRLVEVARAQWQPTSAPA